MSLLYQVAAISEQASETSEETVNSEENFSNRLGWKSFNMRAVVAATEDLLLFILSEKGQRVRVFLIRDIINAVDVLLQEEVFSCIVDDDKTEARQTAETEVCVILVILFCSQTSIINGNIKQEMIKKKCFIF